MAWQRRKSIAEKPLFGRSSSLGANPPEPVVAAVVRLCRAGLSGLGRIHGSRQLGHRHPGRVAIRLPAHLGAADEQRHGRVAANPKCPAWGWSPAAIWPRPATTIIPGPINIILYVLCEIAIAACDLAEVLGSAIGLNLLSAALGKAVGLNLEIPVLWGVLITGFDVLLVAFYSKGRHPQTGSVHPGLVLTIGLCFLVEIFLCKPSIGGIAARFCAPHAFGPGVVRRHRHYRRHGNAA